MALHNKSYPQAFIINIPHLPFESCKFITANTNRCMRKFSQQQLMQFLYEEASPILKMAIDKALQSDLELQNEIKLLKKTQKQINDLKKKTLVPSKKTIDAIMEYARQTASKKA